MPDIINDCELIRTSPLFDAGYYTAQFALDWSAIDPARHFLETGYRHLASPSASFNAGEYLAAYPDAACSGMNPLLHYLKKGRREGRRIFAQGTRLEPEKKRKLKLGERLPQNAGKCRRRLAIFAYHDDHFHLSAAAVHLLEMLAEAADGIIFVSGAYLPFPEMLKIRHLLSAYECGQGKDSPEWMLARGIELAAGQNLLRRVDELFLCSDRLLGASESFQLLLEEISQIEGAQKRLAWQIYPQDTHAAESEEPALTLVRAPLFRKSPGRLLAAIRASHPAREIKSLAGSMKKPSQSNRALNGRLAWLPLKMNYRRLVESGLHEYVFGRSNPGFPQHCLSFLEHARAAREELINTGPALNNLALRTGDPHSSLGQIPAISIVIPVGSNREALFSALDSILAQEYADFEIILVDDNPQAGIESSLERIYGAAIAKSRLRYIKADSRIGKAALLNLGIESAASPWILHLSHRYRLAPHTLAWLGLKLASSPNLRALHIPGNVPLEILHDWPEKISEHLRSSPQGFEGLVHRRADALALGGLNPDKQFMAEADFVRRLDAFADIRKQESIFLLSNSGRPDFSAVLPAISLPEEPVITTIIVAAPGQAASIEKCIESALAQTGGFGQDIIIAMPEADEETAASCQLLARRFPGIIRIRRYAGAEARASDLAAAIADARGDLIAFLSGSDYWSDPRKLAAQLGCLRDNGEFRMCFSDFCESAGESALPADSDAQEKSPQDIAAGHPGVWQRGFSSLSTVLCDAALLKAMPQWLLEDFSLLALGAYVSGFGKIACLPSRQTAECAKGCGAETERLIRSLRLLRNAKMALPAWEGQALDGVVSALYGELEKFLPPQEFGIII